MAFSGDAARYDYSFGNATPSLGGVVYSIGNPNLKWESTSQVNLGLDLGFFKDRITLTTDYYKKVTDDLLLKAPLPGTAGYADAYKNIGKVSNEGLEFTLNTVNIESKTFQWTSNFNISFNRNEVLALAQNQETLETRVDQSTGLMTTYIAKVGEPIGMFYGTIADGLYQYSDFDKGMDGTYVLKSNVPSLGNAAARVGILPGYAKYKDLNNDLVIDNNDYTIIGNPNPDFTGGVSNTINYKGFDLNVFMQFSYGNDLMNANRVIMEEGIKENTNQFATLVNRWTVKNPNSNIPRVRGYTNANNNISSRIIEDGSYLKLKTVTLGYTVPKKLISRLRLSDLRVYVSGQNLWCLTDYTGQDPEISTKAGALTPGYDYSAYPFCRIFTGGISVSF
jgi:TonB-dependent starch-binding outer membrane protein SusC